MNVLVIDDETLVRESVAMQLRRMDVGSVAEARDGIEGLEALKEGDYQLVVADIRMPGMDGLTLMAEARKLGIEASFAFISGYDLFSYAKQAVQLGAIDYLLKPIKEAELLAAVNAVRQSLRDREQRQESLSKMEAIAHQGIQSMRKQLIRSLTRDDSFGEAYVRRKFQELDIGLPHAVSNVLCLSIDNYTKLAHELSLRERELIKFSVENIAAESLASQGVANCPFDTDDGIGFVLNYDEDGKDGTAGLRRIGEALRVLVERYAKRTVTVGIGVGIRELHQLKRSYEASQRAILQRLIRGGNQVYAAEARGPENGTAAGAVPLRTEQALLSAFERKDRQLAREAVDALLEPYRGPAAGEDASSFTRLNFQLILILFKHLRQLGLQPEEVLGEEFLLTREVNACDSLAQVSEWFSGKLDACFDAMAEAAGKPKGGSANGALMEKAKQYIRAHFASDVTLDSVAQHVNLSPSYFSTLFKEETGENFHAFLLDHRMNVARALLKEGVYKANQVAGMVGFQDEKYFYKVFKKMTGYTPSEYRQL
ncbi:response regulator [Cohnella sp. GCM10027633]|uniref:response regulator n=1 Tax=unclassified Cohnella TaxID=2636738 RepID=UPI0036386477